MDEVNVEAVELEPLPNTVVELTDKVTNIIVTQGMVSQLAESKNQFSKGAFHEFQKESCTYSDPEPEAHYDVCEYENCDAFGGWEPHEGNSDDPNIMWAPIPEEMLNSISKDYLDSVLVPRNPRQFIALKKIVMELEAHIADGTSWEPLTGHPEWPKYGPDLTTKWDELLKLEELRLRIAQCKQLWHDMWENHPDEMRETLPDYLPKEEELKGLVVIYVNVGHLNQIDAEKYMDKVKSNCKKMKNIPLNYGVMWLPVRPPEQNKVEIVRF